MQQWIEMTNSATPQYLCHETSLKYYLFKITIIVKKWSNVEENHVHLCSYPLYRSLLGLPIVSCLHAETMSVLGLDCENLKNSVNFVCDFIVYWNNSNRRMSIEQIFLQMWTSNEVAIVTCYIGWHAVDMGTAVSRRSALCMNILARLLILLTDT